MSTRRTTKPFEQWLREEVETTFGIKKVKKLAKLDEWLATDFILSERESADLENLFIRTVDYIELYNEDELKLFFISEVLKIVNFQTTTYRAFTQRTMEFTAQTVDNETITVKGIVDLVVATGQQVPRKPFFFLQEFKQSLKRNNDPLGQVLIAMLAAQVKNQDENPIYGCYVLGEHWHFVILDKKEYAVSAGYDVTNYETLMRITSILKEQKKYVENILSLLQK